MRTYYRALPQASKGAPDAFDWVREVEDATKDYLESVEKTQKDLKRDYGIDTELDEVPDGNLMKPKYALSRDVDSRRMTQQIIEPGKGITTQTDEVLTNPEPGDSTFEGIHEILGPEDK